MCMYAEFLIINLHRPTGEPRDRVGEGGGGLVPEGVGNASPGHG